MVEVRGKHISTADTQLTAFARLPRPLFRKSAIKTFLKKFPSANDIYCLCREWADLSEHPANKRKFTDEDGDSYFLLPHTKIAEELDISIATVDRTMSALKKAGLIDSVRQGTSNTYRLYICDISFALSLCEGLVGTINDDSPGTATDDSSEPARLTALIKHTKDSQTDNKHTESLCTKNTVQRASTSPAATVKSSSKGFSLFEAKKITKAQKNADKWFLDRKTQLNGHNFAPNVQMALERFLRCRAGTEKSYDQFSADAWSIQLEMLHKLDRFPHLQSSAVYDACGYRTLNMSIKQTAKYNKLHVDIDYLPGWQRDSASIDNLDKLYENPEEEEAF